MNTLDYELLFISNEWQVWMPDATGACIGAGAAKTTALRDAIENLTNTANMLRGELEATV